MSDSLNSPSQRVYIATANRYANNYQKSLKKLSEIKNSWFYSLSVDKNGVLIKRFALLALFDHLGSWANGENWEQKLRFAAKQFIILGKDLDMYHPNSESKTIKQISALAKQAGVELSNSQQKNYKKEDLPPAPDLSNDKSPQELSKEREKPPLSLNEPLLEEKPVIQQAEVDEKPFPQLNDNESIDEPPPFIQQTVEPNPQPIEDPLEDILSLDQQIDMNLDVPHVGPKELSINELYEKAGKFASYYTANKTPMMNFLKGIGCLLDKVHTLKGDDFLKEEKYEIQIPPINDFYNPNPVTITVSSEKIRAIMSSAKVVISDQLGIDEYKKLQMIVDDQVKNQKFLSTRSIVINDSTLSQPNYSAEMYACQICHSARLPVLTSPYNSSGAAHQQLSDINLDDAPEIVLINTPGANFAYGNGFRETFLNKDNGDLKVAEFENFLSGLWTNVIFSAIEQNATDLSLLPIGLGAFLKGLAPETNLEIQKSYLRSLKAILEDPNIKPKLEDQFKRGIFFSLGPIAKTIADEIFQDSNFVHFHDRDALNLSQEISTEPGHCCAILNPSDGDVMFGIYNVGEYWQTSYKGTSSHVGEEYLMHLIPGQLTGRDMCPEAFENPIVSKLN